MRPPCKTGGQWQEGSLPKWSEIMEEQLCLLNEKNKKGIISHYYEIRIL